ncbi:VOC family protein [uncultured Psychroserpens sp.]|uniref:VOC family protein n=1 Tax=uncultured Psychroserpens sp. TaxID=255436 RepID=UPI002631CE63|nr:VOC family protein [uncultured Psychroserpens sp.]
MINSKHFKNALGIKPIKLLIITLAISILPALSLAQDDKTPVLEAYFSALIVNDMDVSLAWYTDVIGLEILNTQESPDAGFKQANLKLGNILIELIELDKAQAVEDAIPNYTSKTRIEGFFKIGFSMNNFDAWIKHLKLKKVAFHGTVVTNKTSGKRMVIVKDPDGNRIQFFEK